MKDMERLWRIRKVNEGFEKDMKDKIWKGYEGYGKNMQEWEMIWRIRKGYEGYGRDMQDKERI